MFRKLGAHAFLAHSSAEITEAILIPLFARLQLLTFYLVAQYTLNLTLFLS